MVNILIGCTGSVASLKIPLLAKQLLENQDCNVKIISTEFALKFFDTKELPENVQLYRDKNEWDSWSQRGDLILHIDLGKWADILLLAPLDANTLAKIANGICDNLLTCTVRAWDISKPLFFCPAMNTKMFVHPLTMEQISKLESWDYHLIPAIEKTLVCGDTGIGAMAEVSTIVQCLKEFVLKSEIL